MPRFLSLPKRQALCWLFLAKLSVVVDEATVVGQQLPNGKANGSAQLDVASPDLLDRSTSSEKELTGLWEEAAMSQSVVQGSLCRNLALFLLSHPASVTPPPL